MSQFVDAEAKIAALVGLLRTSGGFRIDAAFKVRFSEGEVFKPDLSIELSGSDMPVLLRNNAELLHAIKHVASTILRLDSADAARFRFDAADAGGDKESELERLAKAGIEIVRATAQPYRFPALVASERQLLHLALASSGLKSANTGLGLKRGVILYPEGIEPPLEQTPAPDGSEPRSSRCTAA